MSNREKNFRKEKRVLKNNLIESAAIPYETFLLEKFISTFSPGSIYFYIYLSSFFFLVFLVLFFFFRLFIDENYFDIFLFILTTVSLFDHIFFKDQMLMSLYFGMDGFKINKDLVLKNLLNEHNIFAYLSYLKKKDLDLEFEKKYNWFYYYPVLIFLNISLYYILIFNYSVLIDGFLDFLLWIENNSGKFITLFGIAASIFIHIKTKRLSFLIIGIFLSLFIGASIGIVDVFFDAGSSGWGDENF